MFDLAIVGGGLVGTGLACALKDTPLNIALIDNRKPDCHDPRLFALSITSCTFLKKIGLWEKIAAYASPIKSVHVSQQGRFGALRLKSEDLRLPQLGFMVPAYKIEEVLNESAQHLTNVKFFRPSNLLSIEREAQHFVLKIEGQDTTLSSKLLMGADGTHSTVRKYCEAQVTHYDYQQSAIVTQVEIEREHKAIAYERFTDDGVLALLPLQGKKSAVIWSADLARIHALNQLSDHEFLQKLQKTFGNRLGRLTGLAKRAVFPLHFVQANNQTPGITLIGNAAHSLHPIAAQGFNLALLEVAHIVEKLQAENPSTIEQLAKDKDLLKTLNKQKRFSIQMSHWLAKLFSKPNPIMRGIMQTGLLTLDALPNFKQTFLTHALGQSTILSSLFIKGKT